MGGGGRARRQQRRMRVLLCLAPLALLVAVWRATRLCTAQTWQSPATAQRAIVQQETRFHAIARSATDAQAFIDTLSDFTLTTNPCVLHVHLRDAVHAISVHAFARSAGAYLQCTVRISRLRQGSSWSDIPIDVDGEGMEVFIRIGAQVGDDAVQWLADAHDAVRRYEAAGGRRDVAALVVPCGDEHVGACAVSPTR
eukprot:IDg19862t1